MRALFAALLVLVGSVPLAAQGNYYDAVLELTGQTLYTALHALISTNTYNSYDGAKVQLFQELDNVNGYVTCIYTGYAYNVGYNYTGSSDPNTEHTYAQSWFTSPESSIKKADLHHLFPSNSVVNSSRGNYPLFTVASHASANVYYSYTPWQSFRGPCVSGPTVFEPADESKGNIARALLYFNTRYYDTLTQQNVNMIPDLVQWHFNDPPDVSEIARNNGIQAFQTNRNPYVDHPEFVSRIWGGTATDDPASSPAASLVLAGVGSNPFRESTTLTLNSRSPLEAEVAVFNSRGQKLRSWRQTLPQGDSRLSWDGMGDAGERLPAGIYLIRIHAGGSSLVTKVLKD